MKARISRKQIQDTIEVSLNTAFERLKLIEPSRRVQKIAKKAAQKLSVELKAELKKLAKKSERDQKEVKKKKKDFTPVVEVQH